MGKAIRASALVLLLVCSAQAGWIHADKAPPPPAEQVQTTDSDAADETQDGVAEALTQAVLDLLARALALV
jgi:hypothetical protein